ncbi:hypothetical protein B5S28_g3600 [[Candida] boidinii]|uniref:Unnamed protein product n=1 Tax=Candida boidinii TaxID=5477 RepID=A0ACB5U7V1_CANBO|nr:hypothetical protein B5S28_g3600 [[Candida] boidinii]OWB63850.1 hypothetical protein B5S29_g4863 [[Candida] boidinii]OWB75074.1 hypothetical protein B5S31_g4927 [[Candida] boidinii]OWB80944.1 hypothetical protein B5S32_g5274 [[Candida] boidinii]GME84318.1 unnamed protein product [[Candida] boidinii]
MTNQDTASLKAEIQQRLISSGKYDEIYRYLQIELMNSGWYDKIKLMAQDQISKDKSDNINFNKNLNILEPQALSCVPNDVKEKLLIKIKEFLDSVVEN